MSKITEKDYKELARNVYKFYPEEYKSEQQIQIGDPIDINGRIPSHSMIVCKIQFDLSILKSFANYINTRFIYDFLATLQPDQYG